MKFLNSDFLVLGLSAIILPSFSLLLYLDFTYENVTTRQKQIGKISFKKNIALRKYSDQLLWYKLKNDGPLFNKDTIRTEEQSIAVVLLNDGTSLEVGENSMILLDFSAQGINIDFSYGSIQAKSGKGSGIIKIKSKEKIISLSDGELKLSKNSAQDLSVVVQKGTVKIEAGGEEKILKKDEQAIISKNKFEIKKINIIPLKPRHNKRFFIFSKKKKISFTWKKTSKREPKTLAAQRIKFEISKDKNFSKKNYNRYTIKNSITASASKGIYYWRISLKNPQSKKRDYSDVQSFSVVQDRRLVLYVPDSNRNFEYFQELPIINFSWSKNQFASSYLLEIAKTENFTETIKSEESYGTNLSITSLKPGRYFWRVQLKTNIPGINGQTSEISSFQIIQKKEIDPPTPVSPGNHRKISQFLFKKEGIVFNWLKSNEIVKTKFILSNDKNFKKTVFSGFSKYNYFNLKKSLPRGKYYWRLVGLTGNNDSTGFSRTRAFELIELTKLTLLQPVKHSQFEYFFAKNNGVTFVWKRPETYGKFRLEISKSKDFLDVYFKKNVLSYSVNLSDIKPGTYFWKVSLIGEDNKIIIKSDPGKFSILRPLADPVAIFPAPGLKIDMSNRNSLQLKWKAPKDSNIYIVEIFQDAAGWNKKRYSVKTKNSYITITDLSILDLGKFYWTVKALKLGRKGNLLRTSAEIKTNFYIKLSQKLKKPEIISPSIQFLLE